MIAFGAGNRENRLPALAELHCEAATPHPYAPTRCWRAGTASGGSPGLPDGQSYAAWKSAAGLTGDGDSDGDSLVDFAEYALGSDPNAPSAAALSQATRQPLLVDGLSGEYLVLTFNRSTSAAEASVRVECSLDLKAPATQALYAS